MSKIIYLNGRTPHSFLKKTACCGTCTTVHVKCAGNFSKYFDSSYEIDNETYGSDLAMTLCFAQHKQKYLHGDKKHVINNKNASVIACTECKKNWNYHVKPTCKNKYTKIIANTLCAKTVMLSIEKERTYPLNVVYLQLLYRNMYHLYHPVLLLLI